MNAIFDINRFFKVMRRELLVHLRSYSMVAAFIFGLFFLIYFISILLGNPVPPRLDSAFFYLFLVVGGAVFTSMTFADVKRPVGYFYLTIPASITEKAVSKWIITVFGWLIAYSLAYFLFATLGKFSFSVFNDSELVLPQLNKIDLMGFIRLYLITNALFFLGAATFKKNAFVLTIVTLAVIGMVSSLITAIFFKIFGLPIDHLEELVKALTEYFIPIIWVIILLLWGWAFNRLRKTQL